MESSAAASTSSAYPDRPSDQEILDFERSIKQEEHAKPLISSEIESFDGLLAEYSGNPGVKLKLEV